MKLAIVQARMASTRLPGKVMREVLGKPLIEHLVERLKRCRKIDKIVVATSTDASNDALCLFLEKKGIETYRGSEEDVLDRFYRAASKYSADTVVRLTADCPLLDPEVIDRTVELYEKNGLDYAATASDTPGFPDGLDAEVFSFRALETAWREAHLPSEREHVTPYIEAHAKKGVLRPAEDHSKERWTVDEEADFIVVKAVLEGLAATNPFFGMEDVLKFKAAHPGIFDANKNIGRNEGYQKSLSSDTPLVSVVVAVHNGERYLGAQLQSVAAQSYRNLEILVIDDGSSDGSLAVAEGMADRDSRVRIVRNEANLGLVANFIKGASLVRGEYVLFCDQDDLWKERKVETLKRLLDANPKNMLAYSDLEICSADMEPIAASFFASSRIRPQAGKVGGKALLKNLAPGCAMMFRRPVRELMTALYNDGNFRDLNRAKMLDEIPVMHDHLALVLAAGLGSIVFTNEALVRYRQHARNNIGAFYPARRGGDAFVRALELRLEALKNAKDRLPGIDWAGVRRFAEAYKEPRRRPMPDQIAYFLWMRNSALSDRLLGALDCFVPGLYRGLKGLKKR